MCGCKVGKECFFGDGVYLDAHPDALEFGDGVYLAPNVLVLTHKRDLSNFAYGKLYRDQPHVVKKVVFCDNSYVGMGAIVMPGVTIGEGACVAAGALVVKDVPPWTVVAGSPAKPMRVYHPDGSQERVS